MTRPVEFSKFFKLLQIEKEGNSAIKKDIDALLTEFKNHQDCESALEELGQTYITLAYQEIFNYSEKGDLPTICLMDKSEWDILNDKNGIPLPQHLANTMISFAKKNKLVSKLSEKWATPRREIEKNINGMARYITEGFIEILE